MKNKCSYNLLAGLSSVIGIVSLCLQVNYIVITIVDFVHILLHLLLCVTTDDAASGMSLCDDNRLQQYDNISALNDKNRFCFAS